MPALHCRLVMPSRPIPGTIHLFPCWVTTNEDLRFFRLPVLEPSDGGWLDFAASEVLVLFSSKVVSNAVAQSASKVCPFPQSRMFRTCLRKFLTERSRAAAICTMPSGSPRAASSSRTSRPFSRAGARYLDWGSSGSAMGPYPIELAASPAEQRGEILGFRQAAQGPGQVQPALVVAGQVEHRPVAAPHQAFGPEGQDDGGHEAPRASGGWSGAAP